MKETLKKLSAGLLTLAVIGSAGGYLASSLAVAQPKPAPEATTMQTSAPAVETVTVVGTRRAS